LDRDFNPSDHLISQTGNEGSLCRRGSRNLIDPGCDFIVRTPVPQLLDQQGDFMGITRFDAADEGSVPVATRFSVFAILCHGHNRRTLGPAFEAP
jgi:hypothetical protein